MYILVRVRRANADGTVTRYINPRQVMWVCPNGSALSAIRMADGETLQVEGPAADVAKALATAEDR